MAWRPLKRRNSVRLTPNKIERRDSRLRTLGTFPVFSHPPPPLSFLSFFVAGEEPLAAALGHPLVGKPCRTGPQVGPTVWDGVAGGGRLRDGRADEAG